MKVPPLSIQNCHRAPIRLRHNIFRTTEQPGLRYHRTVAPPSALSHVPNGLPYETVPVEPDPEGRPLPEEYQGRVSVDVIHDGWILPEPYLTGGDGAPVDTTEELVREFEKERDWGASLVAESLAAALHLPSFFRVTTARSLLDFGRFPGITQEGADYLRRYAINYPFSQRLGFAEKRSLLEEHYDGISAGMDQLIRGRLLKIGVHTYDEHNPSMTRRPAVSLLTRSLGHQEDFELSQGVFDPLFPGQLVEYTADRILRARIALALEEAAIYAADNYPYALPEGSVEVRSQVWFFFQYLRDRFDAAHPPSPEERDDPRSPRNLVWSMLLDTNLRSSESELLRSYLHMYRRPPSGLEDVFRRARGVYERIRAFTDADDQALVHAFRASERTSSLGLEVRKDIVWHFEGGRPVGPRPDAARTIARVIAEAIRTYFGYDLPRKQWALAAQDPRFA